MTKVKVQGVYVDLPERYAEGHKINAAEAKALNTIMFTTIRNHNAEKAKELIEKAGGDLDKAAPEVTKLVTDYAKDFEFTLSTARSAGGKTADPLEKECRKIARAAVTAAIKEKGLTIKQYKEENGEDSVEELVDKYADAEQIVAEAKRRLEERKSLAISLK